MLLAIFNLGPMEFALLGVGVLGVGGLIVVVTLALVFAFSKRRDDEGSPGD